ncbi:MAG: molecular chaperone HtpG [Ruminococcaceae bacterium]|nr:molecular chaperone HtpG [Oscillospiraceae bacterium]
MDEKVTKGGISVETEHLFPIIKKWLYSEKEIFLREIVSNACDAVTKLKRLTSLGQVHDIDEDYKITVTADKDAGTLTVSDNGIGMTEEEVQRYICNIALSGALEFIEKYEGDDGADNGIIGHFGLGFYSAFMVSDKVEVITKSFTDAPAVKWVGNESGQYEITSNYEKEGRGTDIIMYLNDDENDFLNRSTLTEILNKYCSFMPVEIFLSCSDDKEDMEVKAINDTNPLWQKLSSDCTEEEYTEFYNKVFSDYRDPLFHIHINADYPLNFKGILYFPRLNQNYDNIEGQVKLYYNQVFVSDNIKEVLPEYLLMLKGVIDCPELPLNVSRSYMQNSQYIKRMATHISKKVADKINSLYNTERESYEEMWKDMKIFCEFACLRDQKFYDKVKGSLLMELTDGGHVTIDEYLEEAKEKHEKVIYYANDKVSSAWYIKMYNDMGIKVALLDRGIDTQIMPLLEQDKDIRFKRVDSELDESLKGDGEVVEDEELSNIFKSFGEGITVKFESLKDSSVPAVINISEESRRFADMMRMYSMDGKMPPIPNESTLVLNPSNAVIKKLLDNKDEAIAKQVYTLALLSQRPLSDTEMNEFLKSSYSLLEKLL